jgi:hypothetical protein
MINKLGSLTLTLALISTLGSSARADSPATGRNGSEPNAATTKEAPRNEKLRAGITRMIEDTKAGKTRMTRNHQLQPAQSNGLSKGKKIALGIGIAVAVVAVIVIVHEVRKLDDLNLNGIAIR